ncbi:MAG: hypothetical protein HGB32_16265 [Geobacteraceae bacterium]|nr:hypothetical protein [Geobacteraceae bacterium]
MACARVFEPSAQVAVPAYRNSAPRVSRTTSPSPTPNSLLALPLRMAISIMPLLSQSSGGLGVASLLIQTNEGWVGLFT